MNVISVGFVCCGTFRLDTLCMKVSYLVFWSMSFFCNHMAGVFLLYTELLLPVLLNLCKVGQYKMPKSGHTN